MVASLFCFVGMDGSGKSTLSNNIRDTLYSRGIPTKTQWWLTCENSVFRKLLRLMMKGTNNNTGDVLRKHSKSFLIRLYISAISIDYLRYGITNISWPFKKSQGVIILDRYFYDTILALNYEYPGNESLLLRIQLFFSIFLPQPNRIFFIQVSPEVALNRKPDEIKTMENAMELRRTYDEYLLKIEELHPDAVTIINNDQDISVTTRLIESEIFQVIEAVKID